MFTKTALWALLAGVSSAKLCQNFTVPVSIATINADFGGVQTPQTNLDATAFVLAATRQGGSGTAGAVTGTKAVSGTYNISAQYCTPNKTADNSYILQILTHGIGADKTYWDVSYNNYNYSYVDYALSHGYHTLSYDRVGIGASSHGDPKNEIQANLEIESLAALTKKARNGELPGIHDKPHKVIHVGHSFGSVQTYAVTAKYPGLSDGIVLTGFSMNSTFLPWFLIGSGFQQARSGKNPQNYTAGYLSPATPSNVEYNFFYPGSFDPKLLALTFQTSQPVTIGELLTIGSAAPLQSNFTGPVLVITGENDIPFCGGDCFATGGAATSIPAASKIAFSAAKAFSAIVPPKTGHGLNWHYTAASTYKQITNFLGQHGL
ncbi:hypothetical protein N7468_009974 [Penicillium chermesinum]|uniref:AB hydrolase-1 domain-containing protein n=1 Tax=Penicillium chermesinum TaxID=63820 RepID=A0A9W9TC04_9EURO|nr:uncharacterized protein N7468_009974 [Penicillium chermesinum]KAJ5216966.1 hypothetical protein N7468_009974 [Penicillium chermesinum]KAJ6171420.1 hypothetical protein N7470_000487 [Penicillium chermesinum]